MAETKPDISSHIFVPTPPRHSLIVLGVEACLEVLFVVALPLPPSDNELYGRRGKRSFLSSKGEVFKRAAALEMSHIKKQNGKFLWSLVADLCVGPGDYHRFDLSNCFKALIDSVASAIGVDDRYLCGYLPRKVYGHERMDPLVRVTVFRVTTDL